MVAGEIRKKGLSPKRRREAARGVFLAMQIQGLRRRLRLARLLICQSDLRRLAKKEGVAVRDLVGRNPKGKS
jgi:hypothetical protein